MPGEVLDIESILKPDLLGTSIAHNYMDWETFRNPKLGEWKEITQYLYATDTTKTTNSKLPWSNKTTIPKLCQISDNLTANYIASMFPKNKWVSWEGDTEEDEIKKKKDSIENYIQWVMDRNEFYDEATKIVQDYVRYGNCFVTVEWVDKRNLTEDKEQVGYVGPMIKRISPLDIVFNPIASSFSSTPKIIRSIITIGEVKERMERLSVDNDDRKAELEELYNYMVEVRRHMANIPDNGGSTKSAIYNISGFGTYEQYLKSDYVEILTFYGDIYNKSTGEFERNQIIEVLDRHKVLSHKTNPSFFGTAPI